MKTPIYTSLVTTAFGLFFHAALCANEMALSINEEMVEARFTVDYQQDFFGRLALMHADFNEIRADHLNYTFATQDTLGDFSVLLGGRAFWLDSEAGDGFGLSLGVGASKSLTERLSAAVEVFYAPDILTGGDFKNTLEIDSRLSYQLLEGGAIFIGHRKLEGKGNGPTVDAYDDPYFGLQFEF